MKKIVLIISIALALNAGNSFSQLSFGPSAGLSLANLGGDIDDNTFRLKSRLGVVVEYTLNDNFSFQPSLLITGKGCGIDYDEDDKDAFALTYLEVPIGVKYYLDASGEGVFLFAGPYLGICLDAKYKYLSDEDNETEPYKIGNSESDDIKPYDFGIIFGLGYRYQDFQLQAEYGGGFTSISTDEDDTGINNTISLTFSYFINMN